jgi:RimJ/RimL family protein N-acetyltransferase
MDLLEGKLVNLRVLEREDLPLFAEWNNDPEFDGEFEPLEQNSLSEIKRWYDGEREGEWFIVETKDGTPVGQIMYAPEGSHLRIGYIIHQSERGKGYCTEAVRILVDYLFLSKNIVRIQSQTDPRNIASQRVLEKAGFTKEGVIRKATFIRGKWRDGVLFSILREEWKEPKILTKG